MSHFRTKLHLQSSERMGFTLVEVVLSIGILSFAFIGVLGLLPIGLQTQRSSMDATVHSHIAQKLLTIAAQTPFGELEEVAGDYFFDNEGWPSTSANFVFHAQVTVVESPRMHATQSASSSRLKGVLLEISQNQRVDVMRSTAPREIYSCSRIIADVGL